MSTDMHTDLVHIGLVSSSEANADCFFMELLGLEKGRRSELPRALAAKLFGLDEGCEIVYYGDEDLLFEVFITGWGEAPARRISHVCIEVADRARLLERCHAMGFVVREAPKEDYVVVFVEDGDGNLFEVKEKG